MSPQLRLAVLIALATATGCKEPNPLFCQGHPDDPDCVAGDDAPPMTCSASKPCPDNGICDNEMCVQCVDGQTANCVGDKPLCDTTNKVCVGCEEHTDCPGSEACLPSGACAVATDVAYVTRMGSGTMASGCAMNAPCPSLTEALGTGKKTIKVLVGSGVVVNPATVDLNGVQGLVILAEKNAQMSVVADRDILKIGGSSTVEIYDLTLRNTAALGNDKHAVIVEGSAAVKLSRLTINNNQGFGILQNGGTLTLTQSNIHTNTRGGLDVENGRFTVVNNFFFNNGDNLAAATMFGGVSLDNVLATDVFEFNSIARNKAGEGNVAGVLCNGTAGAFVLRNNIVFDNLDTAGSAVQIFANGCTVRKNIEGPGASAFPDNLPTDPLFVAIGAGNLHVQAGSPARNASEMTAVSPAVDIEGDPRPVPSGQNPDIGADEIADP